MYKSSTKMSHCIHNEREAPTGEDFDYGKGVRNQASCSVPNPNRVGSQVTPTNSTRSQAAPTMPRDPNNLTHWQILVIKLMQHIPPAPLVYPPKQDKLADRISK